MIDIQVIAVSTEYRDPRKVAHQEYAVVAAYNAAWTLRSLSIEVTSSLGVGLIASAIALGVCMGSDSSDVLQGRKIAQKRSSY